jgi:hypothetical protein
MFCFIDPNTSYFVWEFGEGIECLIEKMIDGFRRKGDNHVDTCQVSRFFEILGQSGTMNIVIESQVFGEFFEFIFLVEGSDILGRAWVSWIVCMFEMFDKFPNIFFLWISFPMYQILQSSSSSVRVPHGIPVLL